MTDLEKETKLVKLYLANATKIHSGLLFDDQNSTPHHHNRIIEIAKMLQMAHRWGQFKKGEDEKVNKEN